MRGNEIVHVRLLWRIYYLLFRINSLPTMLLVRISSSIFRQTNTHTHTHILSLSLSPFPSSYLNIHFSIFAYVCLSYFIRHLDFSKHSYRDVKIIRQQVGYSWFISLSRIIFQDDIRDMCKVSVREKLGYIKNLRRDIREIFVVSVISFAPLL